MQRLKKKIERYAGLRCQKGVFFPELVNLAGKGIAGPYLKVTIPKIRGTKRRQNGGFSELVILAATRVFAIYLIMLGWKTCKYYYETDELPNPNGQPNPRKIRLKVAFGCATFPDSTQFFVGWD